jgi:hypothetical protein
MARSEQNNERPLTRSECGAAGQLARCLTEDLYKMTAAATASPNHVASLDRWVKRAKELNPHLTDEQAERVGERLRTDHYQRMGRLSAQARKITREAEAELARVDGAGDPAAEPAGLNRSLTVI